MEQLELDLGEPLLEEVPAAVLRGLEMCFSETEGYAKEFCAHLDNKQACNANRAACTERKVIWLPKKVLP